MNSFPQLPGEPSDAFEHLLLHRDFGPGRQFSQTADVVGCSESTLRRRSQQWNWKERLEAYDASLLSQISSQGRDVSLESHQQSLETFRQEQLQRAQRMALLAEGMLMLAMRSLQHQLDEGEMLRGRELPTVLSAAVKALEGAMNIEATALGVSELLTQVENPN